MTARKSGGMALFTVLGAATCLALGFGCASQQKSAHATSSHTINATCPGTGGPVKSGITSTFEGKTVGFCCENCKTAWETKMAAADKRAYIAKQSANN